jgi:hypothetical protein
MRIYYGPTVVWCETRVLFPVDCFELSANVDGL